MTPRDFHSVRAALVESNPQLRSDIRMALLEKGIREPATCRSADSFLDVAGREMLDLVVCDSGSFGGQFSPAMQRIRRNALGGNPFVVVIATTNDASVGQVQNALAGGVDDLMSKPAPAKRIVDRIDHLVKRRKPFVATQTYVGPIRANFEKTSEAVGELMEVPNTLRGKVVEKLPEARLRRQVVKAAVQLKERLAEHPLAGIERLVRRALSWQEGDGELLQRHYGDLHSLSLELSGHYRGSDLDHIADLALALAKLAKRIGRHAASGPPEIDLDLLRHLGDVVRGSMRSESGSQPVVREIATLVDRHAEAD